MNFEFHSVTPNPEPPSVERQFYPNPSLAFLLVEIKGMKLRDEKFEEAGVFYTPADLASKVLTASEAFTRKYTKEGELSHQAITDMPEVQAVPGVANLRAALVETLINMQRTGHVEIDDSARAQMDSIFERGSFDPLANARRDEQVEALLSEDAIVDAISSLPYAIAQEMMERHDSQETRKPSE